MSDREKWELPPPERATICPACGYVSSEGVIHACNPHPTQPAPESAEQAAIRHAKEQYADRPHIANQSLVINTQASQSFLAGAKWQKAEDRTEYMKLFFEAEGLQTERDALKQRVAELEKNNENLRKGLRESMSGYTTDMDALQAKLTEAERREREAVAECDRRKAQLFDLNAKFALLEKELAQEKRLAR